MNQPKKRGRPKLSVIKSESEPVKIPYTRDTSDDPHKQSLIDLMETGRSITHFSGEGIRRIDPLSMEG